MANEEFIDKTFEAIKEDAESWYSSVKSIICPYLTDTYGDGTVAFNGKGIRHIKFKKDEVARLRADQFMRLKHIRYAQRILEKSKTLQEYKSGHGFEEKKQGGKKEKVWQEVSYYGFVAIIKDGSGMKRLKIIVKRVANGQPYFWSIVPFWKSNRELRRLHSGDLEDD